jgi:hypothetical protein
MTDRNAPCPCGSGKKFKKCHGASGGADTESARSSSPSRGTTAVAPTPGALATSDSETVTAVQAERTRPGQSDEKPFLVHTGRGVESERTEAERKKHLRKRLQTSDLKGTLVYNSGAFFRPPNPS